MSDEEKDKKKKEEEGKDKPAGSDTKPPEGEQKPKEGEDGDEGLEQPYEYKHPLLRGRTAEEIEQIVQTMEGATREQGRSLSKMQQQLDDLGEKVKKPAPVEDEITDQDMLTKPAQTFRRMLDQTIEPLRAEVREAKTLATAATARDPLRRKFDDWDEVEPYVEEILARQKFPNPNDPGLLETLYFTAKGMMQHRGIQPKRRGDGGEGGEGGGEGGDRQPPARRGTPPQHRASSPPPPPSRPKDKPKLRPLTESERHMARFYKMTDEEYLKLQEEDQYDEESGVTFLGSAEGRERNG